MRNKLNKSESLCILAINLLVTITDKLLYNIAQVWVGLLLKRTNYY